MKVLESAGRCIRNRSENIHSIYSRINSTGHGNFRKLSNRPSSYQQTEDDLVMPMVSPYSLSGAMKYKIKYS